MRGHWLSQTRKLNRHYQSGSRVFTYPWAIPGFVYEYSTVGTPGCVVPTEDGRIRLNRPSVAPEVSPVLLGEGFWYDFPVPVDPYQTFAPLSGKYYFVTNGSVVLPKPAYVQQVLAMAVILRLCFNCDPGFPEPYSQPYDSSAQIHGKLPDGSAESTLSFTEYLAACNIRASPTKEDFEIGGYNIIWDVPPPKVVAPIPPIGSGTYILPAVNAPKTLDWKMTLESPVFVSPDPFPQHRGAYPIIADTYSWKVKATASLFWSRQHQFPDLNQPSGFKWVAR